MSVAIVLTTAFLVYVALSTKSKHVALSGFDKAKFNPFFVNSLVQLIGNIGLFTHDAIYIELRSNSFHLRTALGTCSFLMVCSATHTIIF